MTDIVILSEIEYAPGGIPLYWRNETSGRMRGAVMNFLNDRADVGDLLLIQAYFKHWINAPVWSCYTPQDHDQLLLLRQSIEAMVDSRLDVRQNASNLNRWYGQAVELGIDPL